jgi:hypothetical protein
VNNHLAIVNQKPEEEFKKVSTLQLSQRNVQRITQKERWDLL